MAKETDEGIAYLKALKQTDGPTAGTAAAPAREMGSEEGPSYSGDSVEQFQGAEKRRSRRYKCAGSAELREDGRDIRTWAAFSDVSLHGCYVEVQATYPVGTILHMKLEANGVRVESKGTVRVNYPYLGMGISFLAMSEENVARLRALLSTISRPSVIIGLATASPLPSRGSEEVPLIVDPAAAVQALTDFFGDRQMLMREDFLRILRKSQAPDARVKA
jgi:hypothetical protein